MELFSLLDSYKETLGKLRELSEQQDHKFTEVSKIEKEVQANVSAIEKEALDKKDSELSQYMAGQTSELSERIAQIKQEMAACSQKYEEDRAAMTEAAVSDSYVDDQAVIDEVQLIVSNTRDCLKQAIGEETYEKLASRVEYSAEGLSIGELQGMVDYFNDSESILVLIGKIKNPFLYLISYVENMNVQDREITYKYAVPIFAVGYIVLFILLSKFVFTFVAIGLMVTFVYSIVSTYFLHKMLVAAITIQTNLDKIIDDLHTQILDDRDERIITLDNEYAAQMEHLQDEVEQTMSELQQAEERAGGQFQFDDSEYAQRKSDLQQEAAARTGVLNEELKKMQQYGKELMSKKGDLESKIKNCINHIQDDISTIGESTKLDPVFLMDVNPTTYAVSTFEFPKQSLYCLYKEQSDAFEFINLMCLQLRSKLSPFSFRVTVCDTVTLGASCLKFVTDSEDVGEQRMFRILDSDAAIKSEFDELQATLRKKNKLVVSSFADIDAYNDFMASIESAQEVYEFYFIVNPSNSLYQSPSFVQLAMNGAKVGMYVLVFTGIKQMTDDGNAGLKLVEALNTHYQLVDGTIRPLTKKSIIEHFSKK